MHMAVTAKHPYERVVVSRDEALAMFTENKFKAIAAGNPIA